jgi:hypothetical protein
MLISWTLRALFESGSSESPWSNDEVEVSEATSYFNEKIVGMETLGATLTPTRLLGVNVGYSALTYVFIFFCSAFGVLLIRTKDIINF